MWDETSGLNSQQWFNVAAIDTHNIMLICFPANAFSKRTPRRANDSKII